MLAKNLEVTTNTSLDELDAFLSNPLQHKFTVHESNNLANLVKEVHKDSEGYIASCQLIDDKMKQKFYKIGDFECETEDAFFSVNTFYTTWRNEKCVYELKALYSDIDTYKTGLTQEQVIWLLEEDIFGIKIPYPTWLISSGNGLYYILKFNNNIKVREDNKINFELKEKWKTCMRFIYDVLKDYGADAKAMDASRVLRIDGTYNIKNNKQKEVTILKHYGNTIDDIDEFIDLWLPNEYLEDKPKIFLKAEYTVEKIQTLKQNGKRYGKSLKSLNQERMKDIMRLVKMRNGDCEGMRNYMLLIYTYHNFLANHIDLNQALEDAYNLNNLFVKPEKVSQVNATVRAAYKAYQEWLSEEKVKYKGKMCRKGYNFTNENLIKTLCITEEEQRQLRIIKSKKLVQKKRNQKRKEKRRNEEGLTKREQQKQETIAKILELKEQGLNNTEIAKRLDLARQTVSKYINQK